MVLHRLAEKCPRKASAEEHAPGGYVHLIESGGRGPVACVQEQCVQGLIDRGWYRTIPQLLVDTEYGTRRRFPRRPEMVRVPVCVPFRGGDGLIYPIQPPSLWIREVPVKSS